ncbi:MULTISPECIES: hypothetical protein [unclassified Streptomyces]|uniref:hypothetical protein n=1 Tax=unclassified Streptomyces TaxID=2593676 RepID=UPI002256BAF8|nr:MULTISPECIES: hypothetical protein [unclassified Streptomyces]MCX5060340.1 hypothetical protein [Streptomyces sp. NBC_00452]MCX5286368.1 hypothetical protein [Streptomyces sp. NBC_00183]
MYLRVAGIVLTATALGLATAPGAHAADDPGLAVSLAPTDSDSTPDGPLQPGAPVEVTSGVDLTSLAVGDNGGFTVTSGAFAHPVKVTMQKNSYGQGEGAIRCGIKPGSYPVDIAGHHEGSGLTAKQTHTTITIAGGGSHCDQASGSSAKSTTTLAAVGGGAVLAVGAFAVARHRRSKKQRG